MPTEFMKRVSNTVWTSKTKSPLMDLPPELQIMILNYVITEPSEDGFVDPYPRLRIVNNASACRIFRKISLEIFAKLDHIRVINGPGPKSWWNFMRNEAFRALRTTGIRHLTISTNNLFHFLGFLQNPRFLPNIERVHVVAELYGHIHMPAEQYLWKSKRTIRFSMEPHEDSCVEIGTSMGRYPSGHGPHSWVLRRRKLIRFAINLRRQFMGEPADRTKLLWALNSSLRPSDSIHWQLHCPEFHVWILIDEWVSRGTKFLSEQMLVQVMVDLKSEAPSWFWDLRRAKSLRLHVMEE